jgi:transposase
VANDAASLQGYFARWAEPVEVAVEACSFWPAFVDAIQSRVARVLLVYAQRVKAIASAKLKNDRVDLATLAHLLRTQLLSEAWMADLATRELRQATRVRASLGRERTGSKNQVHVVLHQQGRRRPASDLFGKQGRNWLAEVDLPPWPGMPWIRISAAATSSRKESRWKKRTCALECAPTIPCAGW